MPPFREERLVLNPDHGWTSEPGCQVFVADRGAVRFDFPRGWCIEPGEQGAIRVQDRPSPDQSRSLQLTLNYLRDDLDWTGVTTSRIRDELVRRQSRKISRQDPIGQDASRDGLQFSWSSPLSLDSGGFFQVLVARKWNIQAIFRYEFTPAPDNSHESFWSILLKTVVLGDYVEDPTQRVC